MFIKAFGSKVFYEKIGSSKKNIFILPGWGNNRDTFKYLINYLEREYTIYSLDYPGFGNSTIPTTSLTIFDYKAIVKQIIKKEKLNNLIIIAHSFGGRIVSILSKDKDVKINKIILIDVAGIKRNKIRNLLKSKIYKMLKCIIKHLPNSDIMIRSLQRLFSSDDYYNLDIKMKKTFQNIIKEDLRNNYKGIKQETLIIWGDNDKSTPLKDAYYLRRVIKNSGLVIYKYSSHFSYLENVYLTNKVIYSFIKNEDN